MELAVHRGWCSDPDILDAVRGVFEYERGDDRATGYLHAAGERPWPANLTVLGPQLLDDLNALTGVAFTIVAFQAYRDGSGCGWHTDDAFDAQAILSLGVTRTFGVRPVVGPPEWIRVHHGDLVYMPPGFQADHEHCVPDEDVQGERISLVFRTAAKG